MPEGQPREVRATPQAPITCAPCQTVNPAEHRFCRKCGAPLWKDCAGCGRPRPVDESFCALCGEHLEAIERRMIDQQRARLAEIDDMIATHRWRDATLALHALITASKHPCLADIRGVAERRLEDVAVQQREWTARCAELKTRGQQLLDQYDYAGAARELEQIPVDARDEAISRLLADIQAKAADVARLRERIQAPSGVGFDDRMDALQRLLVLLPQDPKVARWVIRARDQVLDIARTRLAQHLYRQAVELLERIPPQAASADVSTLLKEARERDYLWSELELAPRITETTLHAGQRLLKLDPQNQAARGKWQEMQRRFQAARGGADATALDWASGPAQSFVGLPVHLYVTSRRLSSAGSDVARLWQEHPGQFFVAGGLALQAIRRAQITTNLLPPRSVGVLERLRMPLTERPATSGWGLDLSVSGLKAVRLERQNEDELAITQVVRLPHRLPLTHSEATGIRKALLIETLQRFTADHPVGTADRVCVSWPAIQAFARFLRLPPVEGKKRRDMLQLEARQQIPMSLDQVVWDTFTFPVSSFATRLEPLYSLLLAARRRDLEEHVALYGEVGIEVDEIQCDAAALHNYFHLERFADQPEEGPDVTPAGVLVADVGAELTNLLFSFRHGLWFRSVRSAGDDIVAGLVQRFKLTRDVAAQLAVNPTRAKRMSEVHVENCQVFRKLAAHIEACHSEFKRSVSLGTVREMALVGGAGFTPGLVRFLRYGR